MFELLSPWLAMFLILIAAPFLIILMFFQNIYKFITGQVKFKNFWKEFVTGFGFLMFVSPLLYSFFAGVDTMPNGSLPLMGLGALLMLLNAAFSKPEK